MKILGVETKRVVTPKTTGYLATGCLIMSTVSGVSRIKSLRKTHKFFAYTTALFTALHVGQIEYYRKKMRQK